MEFGAEEIPGDPGDVALQRVNAMIVAVVDGYVLFLDGDADRGLAFGGAEEVGDVLILGKTLHKTELVIPIARGIRGCGDAVELGEGDGDPQRRESGGGKLGRERRRESEGEEAGEKEAVVESRVADCPAGDEKADEEEAALEQRREGAGAEFIPAVGSEEAEAEIKRVEGANGHTRFAETGQERIKGAVEGGGSAEGKQERDRRCEGDPADAGRLADGRQADDGEGDDSEAEERRAVGVAVSVGKKRVEQAVSGEGVNGGDRVRDFVVPTDRLRGANPTL